MGEEITKLLIDYGKGNRKAMERLLPAVYGELQILARQSRYRWRGAPEGLGTQSIVHEAYIKLVDQTHVKWENRAQFFFLASQVMRSLLIDNARRHLTQKRGGDRQRVELEDGQLVSDEHRERLLAVDEALERLRAEDERLARIVECRFFGGLTVEETAEALSLSPASVKRGWNLARVKLFELLR